VLRSAAAFAHQTKKGDEMRKGLLSLLAVALLTAPVVLAQQPAEHKLDHFKFWAILPVPFSANVSLLGPFDNAAWWSADVSSILYVANPTNKTHGDHKTKIENPNLHYVAYSLKATKPQPAREVTFQNQFTTQPETWKISDPTFLLLPAGKEFFPEPAKKQNGDHFVCYATLAPSTIMMKVTLQDQFDVKRDKDEVLKGLQPAYFCAPAQKKHASDPVQPLLDAKTYVAVYKIFPQEMWNRRVNTVDQFGERRLDVIGSRLLAVPSTKVEWKAAAGK
jgi:hypothetical protein